MQVWSNDDCPEQELYEHFKFEVEGHQFSPKFKSGLWDGFKKLYSLKTKLIRVGLKGRVVKFLEDRGYKVVEEVNDEGGRKCRNDYVTTTDHPVIESYIRKLPLSRIDSQDLVPMELYDYQVNGAVAALQSSRRILVSPTSSGKSTTLYASIRWVLDTYPDSRVMLIVPSKGLVEQMWSDFTEYSHASGWIVEEHCQKISGDYTKDITKRVVITTWQSQTGRPPKYFDQFQAIFVDEAHEADSDSISKILDSAKNTPIKIGVTGTLKDCAIHELEMVGLFGEPYQVVTTKELMDRGIVSPLKIKCVVFDHPESEKAKIRKIQKDYRLKKREDTFDYADEMEYIISHEQRNRFIVNLANDLDGNVLILFNYVEKQGKVIQKLLEDSPKAVHFIDGSVKSSNREQIRKKVNTSVSDRSNIILASYGTTSRGWSVNTIDYIIFATSYKSKVRNLQSIGRGLRLSKGKDCCVLYDIADDLSTKNGKVPSGHKLNASMKHLLERLSIYDSEQFNYKLTRIELDDPKPIQSSSA